MSFLDRSRSTDEVAADLLLLGLGGTALLDELFVRCHTDIIRMIMNFKSPAFRHSQPPPAISISTNLREFKKEYELEGEMDVWLG